MLLLLVYMQGVAVGSMWKEKSIPVYIQFQKKSRNETLVPGSWLLILILIGEVTVTVTVTVTKYIVTSYCHHYCVSPV